MLYNPSTQHQYHPIRAPASQRGNSLPCPPPYGFPVFYTPAAPLAAPAFAAKVPLRKRLPLRKTFYKTAYLSRFPILLLLPPSLLNFGTKLDAHRLLRIGSISRIGSILFDGKRQKRYGRRFYTLFRSFCSPHICPAHSQA